MEKTTASQLLFGLWYNLLLNGSVRSGASRLTPAA